MKDVCLYFQVHQPYRLHSYRLFDIGSGREYFDRAKNDAILHRVSGKCYVPTNRLLQQLIAEGRGHFRVALSISGTLLDQLQDSAPGTLESFQALAATGGVELLGETYYHSLASLVDTQEFRHQVEMHRLAIRRHFGVRPTVFRNTELIFFDGMAPVIDDLGFEGALVEGADHILQWRSPNYVYQAAGLPGLRLVPRNFSLSDDVGFRFSNRDWDGWPVTADKYAAWLASCPGDSIHIFLDYETFGEHQWDDTGIFEFLRRLPYECEVRGMRFVHPSELVGRTPVGELSFPQATSWADLERDTTAWLGNGMQRAAQRRLYQLRAAVEDTEDPARIEQWRRLTTSDHLYYMCTKWFTDGDVHKYFSPYDTPYDAFIAFMNVMQDLEQSVPVNVGERPAFAQWPEIQEMACV